MTGMAFLRRAAHTSARSRPADPRPAIARFWSWWSEHRDQVLAAANDDRRDELAELLAPAVAAIDPALEWELTAGPPARLTLSAGGDIERRAVTERWFSSAPDDPDVEFAPARQAVADGGSPGTVQVDDFDIDLSELVAGTGVDPRRGALDVVVHHPLFPLLDEDARGKVAALGLAAVLGEDDVQRWVGTVTVSADQPVDAIAMSMLPVVVDQLRPADPWVSLQGAGRKGPVVAVARRPLLRIDRPLADTHLGIVLGYRGAANGLPRDEAVTTDARELQERVIEALGGDGPHAVHVGEVTGGRHIVAHFYVDGLEVDVTAADPIVRTWSHGPAVARHTYDPDWEQVAALRG